MVTPLLTHWRFHGPALGHRYFTFIVTPRYTSFMRACYYSKSYPSELNDGLLVARYDTFTFEVPRYHATYCRPFWMTSSCPINVANIPRNQWKPWTKHAYICSHHCAYSIDIYGRRCLHYVTQSGTQVGSFLLVALTVPSTHYVPKIEITFSPICRGCTMSIAIYLVTMKGLIFSAPVTTPATILHFSCCHQVIAQWTEVPTQWLLHSTCSTKYATCGPFY